MGMRPVTVDAVGAVTTDPIPLNWRKTPFNVTLQVSIVSGAINATVQYTADDIRADGWSAASANWFNHADLTGVVALDIGTLISPVTAVRMANTDTGTARLTIISAGN